MNNNNLLSSNPKAVNAVTGRITVRTPDGFDDTGSNFLKVRFAHFNTIDLGNSNHSFMNKMLDQSGNGGYYLRFDPSFLDIYSPSPSSAKQDVIDAFCTWNNLTEAKLEVVDPCPTGALCFDVAYEFISSSGSTSTVLAAGTSNPSQFSCAGEVVITVIKLIYNNAVTDWKPSSQAGSFDPYVIKTTAYHEGGHMLQLGHVYNTGSLMYPLYSNNFTIDTDATAGGTHVTNVSAATSCTKKFIPGIIAGCMTPISEKNEEDDIEVYPNPFSDELVLNLNEDLAGGIIKFFDATGKILKNTEINSSVSTISTRDLIQGIYFLSFQNGDRITNFKIVKL